MTRSSSTAKSHLHAFSRIGFGEATKQLDDDLRSAYSDIPWREMAGMRDKLIHGYFAVELEIVWETIHKDFPRVKPKIQNVLAEVPDEE